MHPISVKFKTDTGWSKAYTYFYDQRLERDDIVLVPSQNGFFQIGRVKETLDDFKPIEGVKYKNIKYVIPFKYKE